MRHPMQPAPEQPQEAAHPEWFREPTRREHVGQAGVALRARVEAVLGQVFGMLGGLLPVRVEIDQHSARL